MVVVLWGVSGGLELWLSIFADHTQQCYLASLPNVRDKVANFFILN